MQSCYHSNYYINIILHAESILSCHLRDTATPKVSLGQTRLDQAQQKINRPNWRHQTIQFEEGHRTYSLRKTYRHGKFGAGQAIGRNQVQTSRNKEAVGQWGERNEEGFCETASQYPARAGATNWEWTPWEEYWSDQKTEEKIYSTRKMNIGQNRTKLIFF